MTIEDINAGRGLYDPRTEHDACGVGFIADLKGGKSHWIIRKGIEILENLEHRGAVGAEANAGDGAGLLIQTPHGFFEKEAARLKIVLPPPGEYAAGVMFLPKDASQADKIKEIFARCAAELGQDVIGWREVPVNNAKLGASVIAVEPRIVQVFVRRGPNAETEDDFERKLYVVRNHASKKIAASGMDPDGYFYMPSLSCRTVSYKGMLTSPQLNEYFLDLRDDRLMSAIALVHSRFSTNTMPSWPLAHPFRFIAHNGEINTLRGNINWIRAREENWKKANKELLASVKFTRDEIEKLVPVIDETKSDSAILDNAVELLVLGGRPLPQVMMMLIPEAWASDPEMSAAKKAFYEYHATIMEPWDGPASIAFTDGRIIGATLDRNGLRPSRYLLTDDNILVMCSEAGALSFPPETIKEKGRLQPGRMFVASLDEHRIIPDAEIKERFAREKPYAKWLEGGKLELKAISAGVKSPHRAAPETLAQRQAAFGVTHEDFDMIVGPMAEDGEEPIGSMGNDTPLAVLSDKPQTLFNYFYQLFAQVTNPPIDSIREESVMSLVSFLGGSDDLLTEPAGRIHVVEIPHPVLSDDELEGIRKISRNGFKAVTIPILFNADGGQGALSAGLAVLNAAVDKAVGEGANIVILSDRGADARNTPIPSLLAAAAAHFHLIRVGARAKCDIVVETGEAREVHHFALLLGFGATAVNPYLTFETIGELHRKGMLPRAATADAAKYNFVKAVKKGLLKIMAKMGISTIQSYIGAQIFEAVGLSEDLVKEYFTGTASRIGGIGLAEIEEEALRKHRYAFPKNGEGGQVRVESSGQYAWRARGERHTHNPDTIQLLQRATRNNDYVLFKQYTKLVDGLDGSYNTIRALLEFRPGAAVPIEEVEPAEDIVKRFFTGAMSFGSISKEAHETIAIAMNRLKARSNTGEGGEDPERFKPLPNGDSARSAIKQVASGRFGVTSNYLVNADELQIKMAQGAKPGEGGQLPGRKVDKVIARVRHSTPGVGLISPPPHHDIYSIEDLAQLIYDLKNANHRARINVKLVSEVGVGTIAAGVAKGHAEAVLISGHDGGTGASPWSSIKHAGLPWELGLAETHQVLMRNNLRSRIVVQTDGRVLTGRDVAIATLLGAEEWGVATSALIVSGCVMMRQCHLNNCPVGVATQDPELRRNFNGRAEYLVNYFMFLAREMREQMAALGFRTVNEMVGRADMLKQKQGITHFKARRLNLERVLIKAESRGCKPYCHQPQDFGLTKAIDHTLIESARPALDRREKVKCEVRLRNVNRTVGAMLSAEISRKFGEEGLPADTVHIKAAGSAGQSFMAFGAKGITFELEGEANDYFCKGLSGARVVLYPPAGTVFKANENVIVGNVALYGATSGEVYIRGMGGERFGVRNSGAAVVVESCGDHGCEYMTGGRVVVLGPVGKNFAAGMSGGTAYVLDSDGASRGRVNMGMVELQRLADYPDEASIIRKMVERHAAYTSSPHANEILARWEENLAKFFKVMPLDYKRVLEENAASGRKAAAV